MTSIDTPLSDDELDELDEFLLQDLAGSQAMTLDILDGYLHAIAIGPTTLNPSQWLPAIWGGQDVIPAGNIGMERINRILSLIFRHFNGIIAGLEAEPREISPCWSVVYWEDREYEDAEAWACGFVEGMRLCWQDWQPLLATPEGRDWFRPIGLLAEDNFDDSQDELTRTPAQREALVRLIPDAVLAMHAWWLPYRLAVHQRAMAMAMQPKVGRNDPCPCGSGRKFKKCCGAAADLH